MNKNYANDSTLIEVAMDETMVIYSERCENVICLFNKKTASAGLATLSFFVSNKKDIVDQCKAFGLPGKITYTEFEDKHQKYFRAETYPEEDVLEVKLVPVKNKNILYTEAVETIKGVEL